MIHILEKGEKADPLWGIEHETITDEMIEALQQGKRLYITVNNEYAVVIKRTASGKTDKSEVTDSDTISRPKGHWVDIGWTHNKTPTELCSVCSMWSLGRDENFCPNCGADNRGVRYEVN